MQEVYFIMLKKSEIAKLQELADKTKIKVDIFTVPINSVVILHSSLI